MSQRARSGLGLPEPLVPRPALEREVILAPPPPVLDVQLQLIWTPTKLRFREALKTHKVRSTASSHLGLFAVQSSGSEAIQRRSCRTFSKVILIAQTCRKHVGYSLLRASHPVQHSSSKMRASGLDNKLQYHLPVDRNARGTPLSIRHFVRRLNEPSRVSDLYKWGSGQRCTF